MRAKQISNLDLQLIAAKTKQFSPHLPAKHPFAPYILGTKLPTPQPLESNDIAEILTKRLRQVPNVYWQLGQPIGAPVSNFRQIRYLPLPNAVADLDKVLSEATVDCGRDLHKQLIEFGGAAKVWMIVQVEYEPVNPLTNKQPVEQYVSASATRMFRRDETISAFGNPSIDTLHILTDRIREFNAKFIRDKSGLRLARIMQLTLNIVKYAPLEGRGWQPLREVLTKKKTIINIQNENKRCFGYAHLYFLERANLPDRNGNCIQATIYNEKMFQPHHLDTLPYPISPNNVHLYEDQFQTNINVFS